LVRRAQAVARSDDDAAMDALFHGLRADQAVYLARAFTCAAMLSNLGEDVVGRRRDADAEAGDPEVPATLEAAAEEKQVRDDLFREVALLWKARMHRPERITPADEIRNTLAIVRRSILPA